MKNKIQLYATLSEQFQCHTVETVSMSHCRNSFNATLSEQFQCHTVGTVSKLDFPGLTVTAIKSGGANLVLCA